MLAYTFCCNMESDARGSSKIFAKVEAMQNARISLESYKHDKMDKVEKLTIVLIIQIILVVVICKALEWTNYMDHLK